MFNRPLITFVTFILWSIHGSLAANEFTYVAFGAGPADLPFGTDTAPGAKDTISVVPIGVASGVTTYLYNEVLEEVVTAVTDSQRVTGTVEVTISGTIVASASGFVASAILQSGEDLEDTADIECHYTDSVSGECAYKDDLIGTFTTTGLAITGSSLNGGMPNINLGVEIIVGMVMGVSTLVGVCIIWI
ncbi:hypothetical protein BDP27DRAFT_1342948 [Rhodocollybia butyracea]|uniref:Uncharacterized protein n=1 Tax=Rhodocollybia butyracea TaxID=206335 RepID=A0A9P5P8G5_9AGAR|nr:hypothetical protein BDP27DRAFT_1342948 [Rhodocollybia butyracea]